MFDTYLYIYERQIRMFDKINMYGIYLFINYLKKSKLLVTRDHIQVGSRSTLLMV